MITKFKNIDMVQTFNAMAAMQNIDFPVKISFAFTSNLDALFKAAEPYNKEYDKIQNKFKKDEEALNKALSELQSIEVEVDVRKEPMRDLLNCGVAISPFNLSMLKFMLEEDDVKSEGVIEQQ